MVNEEGRPISFFAQLPFILVDTHTIIQDFGYVARGIVNYYQCADNSRKVLQHIVILSSEVVGTPYSCTQTQTLGKTNHR